MKNKDKVAELIAALKAEAENEFELHRINVLEKDLLEGMPKVEVIDDTHQRFRNRNFVKSQSGHYKKNMSMHVLVYESVFGQIPEDYVVHHKDGNKANNNIENLQAMTRAEHRKIHSINGACTKKKEFVCENCGKTYIGYIREKNRFCSSHCAVNWHIKNGTFEIEKICPVCNKKFVASKDRECCSYTCANKLRWKRKTKFEKKCKVCGKTFFANKAVMYCSAKCKRRASYLRNKNKKMNERSDQNE